MIPFSVVSVLVEKRTERLIRLKKEVVEVEAELSECMKQCGENRRTECTSELADDLLQENTGELEAVTLTQDSDHQNELTSIWRYLTN